ncbi:MAG TPA: DUF5615 family PIN-like protein [Thermomicrobiales bacterium]|jgi:predicted nuclease of predicted toxin-antitoxin system
MRSLSDLCIPDSVHDYLRQRGWGILRADTFNLVGQPDENVWAYARRENRVLISADDDFRDARRFPLNNHPGCIMIDTSKGQREGEAVIDLLIRTLATALPHLPSHVEMRETNVYLYANSGTQVFQNESPRTLYRLT